MMKPFTLLSTLAAMALMISQVSAAYVLRLGEFEGSNGEFEQENSAENNAQYYAHAGDYRGLAGRTGQGLLVSVDEPLKSAGNIDGMRRAVTAGFPTMEIFFQLQPEHLTEDYLLFSSAFVSPGTNSSHNLKISLNGQQIWSRNNVTASTGKFDFAIRSSEFDFAAGVNYLTIERTGGGATSAWISLDAVHLQAIPEPSQALLAGLGSVLLLARRRRSAR